jgi:hypothetical protein
MQNRNSRVKRAAAALLAIGTLAVALPATSYGDGGTPPPTGQGGGSGGGP